MSLTISRTISTLRSDFTHKNDIPTNTSSLYDNYETALTQILALAFYVHKKRDVLTSNKEAMISKGSFINLIEVKRKKALLKLAAQVTIAAPILIVTAPFYALRNFINPLTSTKISKIDVKIHNKKKERSNQQNRIRQIFEKYLKTYKLEVQSEIDQDSILQDLNEKSKKLQETRTEKINSLTSKDAELSNEELKLLGLQITEVEHKRIDRVNLIRETVLNDFVGKIINSTNANKEARRFHDENKKLSRLDSELRDLESEKQAILKKGSLRNRLEKILSYEGAILNFLKYKSCGIFARELKSSTFERTYPIPNKNESSVRVQILDLRKNDMSQKM